MEYLSIWNKIIIMIFWVLWGWCICSIFLQSLCYCCLSSYLFRAWPNVFLAENVACFPITQLPHSQRQSLIGQQVRRSASKWSICFGQGQCRVFTLWVPLGMIFLIIPMRKIHHSQHNVSVFSFYFIKIRDKTIYCPIPRLLPLEKKWLWVFYR